MQRGNILLVDDNKAETRLLHEAFKDTKYPRELVTFDTAAAAYDYIASHAKDIFLILCDINMPGMNGPELLEKINEDHEMKMAAIPFIFLTNSAQQEDIERCYSLAPQGYFQKPMDHNDMVALFKLIINYWTAAFIPFHKYPHPLPV